MNISYDLQLKILSGKEWYTPFGVSHRDLILPGIYNVQIKVPNNEKFMLSEIMRWKELRKTIDVNPYKGMVPCNVFSEHGANNKIVDLKYHYKTKPCFMDWFNVEGDQCIHLAY